MTTSPADILFTPGEAASATRSILEQRRANPASGVYLPIDSLLPHLLPLAQDNLVTILGRPGNGKTSLMMWWARQEALRIAQNGNHKQAVVYITYEQSVEDLTAFALAAQSGVPIDAMARGTIRDDQWQELMGQFVQQVALPIVVIGHSIARRQRRPRLTLTAVIHALEYLVDKLQFEVRLVFLDYLQRIPGEKYVGDRRMEVSESLDRCKDSALSFGAPWVVAVQARRDVDSRPLPVPLMADGQETAGIEQASDVVLSVVRPSHYRKEGESFGKVIVSGHSQMLITILKQHLGPDNLAVWINFDIPVNTVRQ